MPCSIVRDEIDLEGLREYLWEHPDGSPKDLLTDGEQTDKIRWIDTSTMLCDPLTKVGSDKFYDRLENSLQESYLDLTPTPESVLKKMRAQKARQQQKASKEELAAEFESKSGYEFDLESYKAIQKYNVDVGE